MSRNQQSKFFTPPEQDQRKEASVSEEINVSEEPVLGLVHNCLTLNVREEPEKDATILCSIQSLTEVMIDNVKSTDEFYKICTASGIEGYCLKRYISTHP